jgi:Zn-dependent protease with chaperone function
MVAARRILVTFILGVAVTLPGLAQPRKLKPGINFFSKDQDVRLGREAATEIEKQVELVPNRDVNDYVSQIGRKLASQPQAGGYPYTFKVVNDKTVNAFALPGGPAYVNTGLISAVENEAQLAGVLAHEISHVALRHGTNQVTKANLIQLPALLAGAAIGNDSILAQLGQIGVGLGANSLLFKFSRSAERDADLLGARIMSEAGYNPIEMARFFEKLEAQGRARGPQFLSDHPNPGNRVKAIEEELQYLPRRQYDANTGQLSRIQKVVAKIPPPRKSRLAPPASASIPEGRPSDKFLQYRSREFRLSYPENWQPFGDKDSSSITFAPPEGIQRQPSGATSIGYGAVVSYYYPEGRVKLKRDTRELIERLRASNPSMKVIEETTEVRVGGKKGLLTVLRSQSHFEGRTEIDKLITVVRSQGLFYIVFIVPESEAQYAGPIFGKMLASIEFTG